MNGKDLITVLEYAKAFNKTEKPKRSSRKEKPEPDVIELLNKKRREAKLLEDYIKELEKIHKKDEKKEEKKGMGMVEKVLLLSTLGPIAGMLYGFMLVSIFTKMSSVVGLH